MLEDPSTVSAGGTGLFTWLTDMVGDEAGWRDAP